ncbi:Predicted transcriptional regulator, ArsR family [Lentzea albidocapillata subsp. violacea]|uniref:Predicted transcriptional regulator, ArsR family n=1 Tax=Lentzea albidocapillata subsp. violacea TaxID=128104 RepID=A0A1G9EZ51_9PSEU|nr:helix-turn-helix domain-containing protein [Lentzea albidocapillata]SDK81459.1 Predicted transcriptional regulator, ArsR family [Lentzea albidocapillata subsp. violacea]
MADPVAAVAALDEPNRRRLYDFVARQTSPISKDEAAQAVELPRTTAAFHLDKLVEMGLLTVVHQRRTGRSGPGAGRPAKLYQRSAEQIEVSLPDRRYEAASHLLTDALVEAETTGEPAREVLNRRAYEWGADLAAQAPGGVTEALADFGFEPREDGGSILLGNCPFHSLAHRHTQLVCGMNLCMVSGLLDGIGANGVSARLDPSPGHCCVRLDQTPSSRSPSVSR